VQGGCSIDSRGAETDSAIDHEIRTHEAYSTEASWSDRARAVDLGRGVFWLEGPVSCVFNDWAIDASPTAECLEPCVGPGPAPVSCVYALRRAHADVMSRV
jgi:hypothetical protein